MENKSILQNQKLGMFDLLILGAAMLLLVFSSVQILSDLGEKPQREVADIKIGKLQKLTSDVRLKTSSGYSWYTLLKSEDVFLGDTIFTGENSRAVLDLGEQGQLDLEPLSLVTVSAKDGVTQVTLHYGEFSSELKTKEILIKTNNDVQLVKPSQAKIVISKNKDKGSIRLVSGLATLSSKKESVKLTTNTVSLKTLEKVQPVKFVASPQEALQFDPVIEKFEKIVDTVPEVEAPPEKVEIPEMLSSSQTIRLSMEEALSFSEENYTLMPSTSPIIEWKKSKQDLTYQVELAKDPEFKEGVLSKEQTQNTFGISSVPAGPLYLRVRAKNQTNIWTDYTPPLRLGVQVPVAIELPAKPSVTKKQGKRIAVVKFKPTPGASKYEVQSSLSPDYKEVVSKKFEGDFAEIAQNENKKIFWKIRALDDKGSALSEFSQSANFIIKPLPPEPQPKLPPRKVAAVEPKVIEKLVAPPLAIPLLKGPSQKETFIGFENSPLAIFFQWGASKQANVYDLEVSKNREFKDILLHFKTKKSRHIYSGELSKGVYFWRVRAKGPDQSSGWSTPREFSVSVN